MNRTQRLLVAAGAVSVVLTLALLVTPLRYAYESTELRVAVETAQALIAALVAFLVYGRYRRSELQADLAIAYSFGVSAATNLFFAVTRGGGHPAAASVDGRFQAWAPLILRVVSALVLAWAATSAPVRRTVRRPGAVLVGAVVATTSIALVMAASFAEALPRGITLEPTDPSHSDLEGPAPLLALQLVLMVVFGVAAWGFARRANDDEPLLQALAVGCVLSATARLHFFLYPSLYSDVVHVGDVVRLAFYAVLLVGASQQIVLYWRSEAEAAAAGERRRMARDLHDGLTQELAFIRSHTTSLAEGHGDPRMLEHVATAATRALDQSRQAVAALASTGGPLVDSMRAALSGLPEAYGAALELDVEDVDLDGETGAALAWIAREATSNALRHGGARGLRVEVAVVGEQVRLSVEDDGTGFDVTRATGAAGYGLRSMRERAALVGGEVSVRSSPGLGTTVEVLVSPRAPLTRGR